MKKSILHIVLVALASILGQIADLFTFKRNPNE